MRWLDVHGEGWSDAGQCCYVRPMHPAPYYYRLLRSIDGGWMHPVIVRIPWNWTSSSSPPTEVHGNGQEREDLEL